MNPTVEYYAEAEPKLRNIAERFTAGNLTRLQAVHEIGNHVGWGRYNNDYRRATDVPVPPGRDPEAFRLETWERTVPRTESVHRLYGHGAVEIIARSIGVVETPEEDRLIRSKGWHVFVGQLA